MMRTIPILAATVIVFATTSAAAREPCDTPAETVEAVTQPPASVDGKPVLGRSAFACGRYWSAANLMEKSVGERAGVLERFNLAASYARTGRMAAAEELYRSVVRDGDFVRARTDTSYTDDLAPLAGFSLASEAQRRLDALAYLQRLLTPVPGTPETAIVVAPPGPRTASDAGVNAAAAGQEPVITTPNAVSIQGGVSDSEALERDGLITPPA